MVFVLLNHYQIIAIVGSAEVEVPISMERSDAVWSSNNEMNSGFKTECNSMANIRDIMVVKHSLPSSWAPWLCSTISLLFWLPG